MKAAEMLCRVVANRMMTPTVFELKFETSPELQFDAGQFISVIIPGAGPKGRDVRRAYSIASEPAQKPLELCVKLVPNGSGTQYLHQLKPGDEFKGIAPYGTFVYKTKPERDVCFIATGTGVAPFRAMLASAPYRAAPPRKAYCFFGVTRADEVLYDEELSAYANLKWIKCLSREEKANHFNGRVTHYLKTLEDLSWSETDFYLCGNGEMIKETKAFLNDRGVEKNAIFQEKYY